MSILSRPYFHDEAAAFERVECILWPQGPVCHHCGSMDKHYKLTGVRTKPSRKNPEGVERHGLYKCSQCRKQFTVRTGMIFKESHLPLHKWLQAIHLMCSSKKGISAHQLHRVLECTYKTAWFLARRIREAMRSDDFTPMGGAGKTVEADETYIRRLHGQLKASVGAGHKNTVLTLVERGGRARSFHIGSATVARVIPIARDNGERVKINTNTVEGYYSIFKRGMKSVYQQCAKHHLHGYLAEFHFRYTNRIACGADDGGRSLLALQGAKGKRLTYRKPA